MTSRLARSSILQKTMSTAKKEIAEICEYNVIRNY